MKKELINSIEQRMIGILNNELLVKFVEMFDIENFILDETTSKYRLMPIGLICEDGRGRVISNDYIVANHGEYPVYSS